MEDAGRGGPLEHFQLWLEEAALRLVLCSLRVSGTLVPVGPSAPLCELGNKLYLPIPSWPQGYKAQTGSPEWRNFNS